MIAVDAGLAVCEDLGLVPDLAVGDFDTFGLERMEELRKKEGWATDVHKPEKDETDTELLLSLIEQDYQPDRIEIYGATGGRIDQLLSNIWIFTQPRFQTLATKIVLIDRTNEISFYLPGQHTITHTLGMTYLGFMPLTPVTGLTLVDEKYRLADWSGNPFSFSSNEFAGEVNHFEFTSGMVAVIQSRDLNGQTSD